MARPLPVRMVEGDRAPEEPLRELWLEMLALTRLAVHDAARVVRRLLRR